MCAFTRLICFSVTLYAAAADDEDGDVIGSGWRLAGWCECDGGGDVIMIVVVLVQLQWFSKMY
jgi:hypothetical protein